jgi:hypothetical protein
VKLLFAAAAPIVIALASPGAVAQALYKCTTGDGRVTYQETPCPGQHAQKRLDAPGPADREQGEATRLLEREAAHGNELAKRFARDARDRELARQREREALARAELLKRKREEANRPAEDIPWNPAWGFPAKPGQALPQPKPAK